MPTRSGLDFGTVHDELNYWLNHTSSYFKGGQNGSGENGNDFAMPTGTPVYAVASGTVVGSGYYGGGGVVSIQQYPGRVWYYQHLDQNVVNAGTPVQAGQLIGYSGGQNVGGNHPSQLLYSSYPHIEVGIDAPWSGIWGGANNVVNGVPQSVDPRPVLESMFTASATGNPISTGGTTQGGIPVLFASSSTIPGGQIGLSSTTDQQGTGPGTCTTPGPFDGVSAWLAYLACLRETGTGGGLAGLIGTGIQAGLNATGFGLFGQILGDPIRMIKLVFGAFLIFASVIVLILPETAAAAVAAAGAPEAAPAVYEGLKHPTTFRPHRTIADVYAQRQQEKQQRYRAAKIDYDARKAAYESQQKQARKQAKQAAKAQAQQATPAPAPAPATPPPPKRTSQQGPFPGTFWQPVGKAGRVLMRTIRIQRQPRGGYDANTLAKQARTSKAPPAAKQAFTEPASNAPSIDDIMKGLREKNE